MFDLLDNVYVYLFIFILIITTINSFIKRNIEMRREIKEYPIKEYVNKVISSVNKMDGGQFEDFMSFIFEEMGYNVRQTPKTRDGGKDLILNTKDGKIYVEIKRYASKNLISSSLILKLIGSAVSDGVDKCIFLTTSGYTNDAMEVAKKSKVDIKLIDIDGFIDMVKSCRADKVLSYLGY